MSSTGEDAQHFSNTEMQAPLEPNRFDVPIGMQEWLREMERKQEDRQNRLLGGIEAVLNSLKEVIKSGSRSSSDRTEMDQQSSHMPTNETTTNDVLLTYNGDNDPRRLTPSARRNVMPADELNPVARSPGPIGYAKEAEQSSSLGTDFATQLRSLIENAPTPPTKPTFNEHVGQHPVRFLGCFEAYAKILSLTDDRMLEQVIDCLQGDARHWVSLYRSGWSTYADFFATYWSKRRQRELRYKIDQASFRNRQECNEDTSNLDSNKSMILKSKFNEIHAVEDQINLFDKEEIDDNSHDVSEASTDSPDNSSTDSEKDFITEQEDVVSNYSFETDKSLKHPEFCISGKRLVDIKYFLNQLKGLKHDDHYFHTNTNIAFDDRSMASPLAKPDDIINLDTVSVQEIGTSVNLKKLIEISNEILLYVSSIDDRLRKIEKTPVIVPNKE
ncbi:hypothetical protein RN001_002293 [Aquatica leii]|uniref:Uncharacterized protein n=1 Tax=Aquatica leii TaxID=1421715 RepID=A0AAN7SK25_9COLE|nr:hypothetical protein RN001_002293 [Aquatica leii]